MENKELASLLLGGCMVVQSPRARKLWSEAVHCCSPAKGQLLHKHPAAANIPGSDVGGRAILLALRLLVDRFAQV